MTRQQLPHRMGFTVLSADIAQMLDLAEAAEAASYDDIWLADTGYPDALTLLPTLGARARKARLGIAVVPAYTRTPAVLASSAATLAGLCGERVVLGLGSSSQTMIEKWHGMPFELPLTRVRETVELIRQIFSGEKSNYQGKTVRSSGYSLPPARAGKKINVPLFLAALRPKMLELAGEIGDGVALNFVPQQALPKMIEHIRKGEARRTDGKQVEIMCRHMTLVIEEEEQLNEIYAGLSGFIGAYFSTPVYNKFLAWVGYPETAEEIARAWDSKDRAQVAQAVSKELIDALCAIGPAEHCRQRIRAFYQAGVDANNVTCVHQDINLQRATLAAFSPQLLAL